MAVAEQLQVEIRENLGKQAAKQTRRDGKVPGVVYSKDQESVAVAVDAKAFKAITRNHGLSSLVELEGLPGGKTLAIYKHLQLHPVNYDTRHIDFQAVAKDEMVTIRVKVVLEGLPVGVDLHGGVLVRGRDFVKIACTPANIPEILTVDVSHLDIGDALHLGDAKLPDIYELVSPANTTLASCGATREAMSKKGSEEGEGAEGEGDAAAEGAEAAAPAK